LEHKRRSNSISKETKIPKLHYTSGIIIFIIILLFISIIDTINSKRKLPSVYSSKKELSIRGDIKSSDNFKIATSKKVYKVAVDIRSLDRNKKDLFITLFSIYSGIDKNKISKLINKSIAKKKKWIVLSRNINSKDAKNIKSLNWKLQKLDVFVPIVIHGSSTLHGLDIIERGEERLFPYNNTLTPVIGHIKKYIKDKKARIIGKDGLEKEYNKQLESIKDGILKGERDAVSNISFNKNSTIRKRLDGATINLNIPLKLQKNIEIILDHYKKKFSSKEIIAAVMESSTGKILTIASSNRYNPERIKQSSVDAGFLSVNAVSYQYEPGSVMKPISISLVLDHGKYRYGELFRAYNKGPVNRKGEYKSGRIKVDKFRIKDDHRFTKRWLTLDDIFIYSSNIGTLTLAQRLTGKEFYYGYKKFGFTKKTGIELPLEEVGVIHSISQYQAYENRIPRKYNVYKATDSYGQGMTATFMQVLKAYSVFNNGGKMVTPQIVDSLDFGLKKHHFKTKEPIRVIKQSTANEIKRLLIKTVEEGTGVAAKVKNIEVGGKTGTANISKGKVGYSKKRYITSFFGFANDDKLKYTIGVKVREPEHKYYYASQSAVPVFKEIINSLIALNYLEPKVQEK
jgi:cell division protein FtsI (penicillin-binding protein 3)